MVCTAARSEICDQRERGVHERRRSPKRTSLLRPTDARAARSVTARAASSARSGDPCPGPGMPPGVRPSLRHLFTLHDASRGRGGAGSRSSARSRREDCVRRSRSISAGLTVDAPNAALGTAIKLPPRHASRAAGIIAAPARFADRRRGKASLRRRGDAAAKFFPVRWSRNLFLLSARGHEAIMTARKEAKETKRS